MNLWGTWTSPGPLVWATVAVLLLTQGWWIFRDAKRRGQNPWLWGAYGLLNVPSSLIVYLLVMNILHKDKKGRDSHDAR